MYLIPYTPVTVLCFKRIRFSRFFTWVWHKVLFFLSSFLFFLPQHLKLLHLTPFSLWGYSCCLLCHFHSDFTTLFPYQYLPCLQSWAKAQTLPIMGKEWYRSSKRSGGGVAEGAETQATPSAGCMCAVFQFFDNFHPFHLATTINHHQQQQETPFKSAPSCIIPEDYTTTTTTIPKGINVLLPMVLHYTSVWLRFFFF